MEQTPELHLGSIIKKVIQEKKYPVTRLAEEMKLHITTVSRFYGQETMQTSQLKLISQFLNHDFFADFSASLNLKLENVKETKAEVDVKNSECEKLLAEKTLELAKKTEEIEFLKKEMGYLKEINDLLRKKK